MSKTTFILRRTKGEMWSKMYIGLHVKYSLFLSDFKEMWIFSKSFEKYLAIKFNENLSSGDQVVPCGRTVRYDQANSRFLQLCERAYKVRKYELQRQ
jgi:hypothetical protein